jgi:hypothetical protein
MLGEVCGPSAHTCGAQAINTPDMIRHIRRIPPAPFFRTRNLICSRVRNAVDAGAVGWKSEPGSERKTQPGTTAMLRTLAAAFARASDEICVSPKNNLNSKDRPELLRGDAELTLRFSF